MNSLLVILAVLLICIILISFAISSYLKEDAKNFPTVTLSLASLLIDNIKKYVTFKIYKRRIEGILVDEESMKSINLKKLVDISFDLVVTMINYKPISKKKIKKLILRSTTVMFKNLYNYTEISDLVKDDKLIETMYKLQKKLMKKYNPQLVS